MYNQVRTNDISHFQEVFYIRKGITLIKIINVFLNYITQKFNILVNKFMDVLLPSQEHELINIKAIVSSGTSDLPARVALLSMKYFKVVYSAHKGYHFK